METTTRPFFALYIVWHPSYANGDKVADLLHQHFGGDRYRDVAGKSGLNVIYRRKAAPVAGGPLPIDWDEAEATAVVVLVDSALANDPVWSNCVRELAHNAGRRGLLTRLFPVAMETEALQLQSQLEEQALRWDLWEESDMTREQRLVSNLTYEFSRMLRYRLGLRSPEAAGTPLTGYLEKVRVFISHSKHDDDGEPVAQGIRDWLHRNSAMSSFFDVYDIPAGLPFHDVLLHQMETSAVVVLVHTDSYSSREWCRREVIEAKLRRMPMVVVDCLREFDKRGIPYMGNVPIVRMSPEQQDRIGMVAGCLLDEVFRSYIWRCRVRRYSAAYPDVLFTACPPELISLASLPNTRSKAGLLIVYPEPPLDADEARLFLEIAPNVRILTLTKWLEAIQ